ncbi:MAG: VCBS repeat-containing protein [bacterium]|nr:VCBS repeat-containing protein [bacterium]
MSQPCLSVLAVRLPGETTDDLVVGMAGGNLALAHFSAVSNALAIRQLLFLGGSLVQVLPWEGRPLADRGIIVAARDPDCVYFLRLADSYPYLQLEQTVELDEDPGTLAWFGDIPGGEGQLAVSLPGMDAIALLADDDGWRVRQTTAVGDDPYSLAAADLDGDGRPEVVAAQRGLLSGNLAVLTAAVDGQVTVRVVEAPGLAAGFVCALDGDGDGIAELAVADRQDPRLGLLRVSGAGFVTEAEITLTMTARQLTMWTLVDGQPALLASNVDRGAAEFASRTHDGWVRHETYYPGCQPAALAVGEFNGDGLPDVAAAAAGGSFLAMMMARPGPEPGFWGLPALTFSSLPGDQTRGDFNGDGRPDVMVASALEPRLSLFVALEGGGISTLATEYELGFTPGKLVALELDADTPSELAVLDVLAGQVVLFDAVAGGAFAEMQRIDVGSYPAFLTSGDIDSDGSIDLLAVPSDGARVQLLYGEPGGGFEPAATLTYEIATTRAVLVDLNGDGRLDIAGVDGASRLWWRVNLGGRDFGPGQWLHAGNGASLIETGDLDGDLDHDVVVGCRLDESLVSYENNGAGGLVRRTGSHVLDGRPSALRIADLDEDGRGDVVVALADRGRFEVYLSIVPWNHLYSLSVRATPEVRDFAIIDANADGASDLLAIDSALRMGVAHLNIDPNSVALEPRALEAGCTAEGGLSVRLEPGLDGPWRLEARLSGGWRVLAEAGGAAAGRLDQEGGLWLLSLAAVELEQWGRPSALRLVIDLGDGRSESRLASLDGDCAAGDVAAGAAWLAGPWPNPGNPVIRASFRLDRDGWTRVSVHDLSGRRVAVLAEAVLPAGDHDVAWDGSGVGGTAAAGTYLLSVETAGGRMSRKLALLK